MTEQARKTRGPEGSRSPEPRDSAYWARYAETLKVAGVAEGATNINVEGRRAVGPLQGFGQMWQKTYRVSLVGADVTPVEVIKTWKENYKDFWPEGTCSTRRWPASRPARSPSSPARCPAASSSPRA